MRESPVTVWNMGCDCIHEICKFLQETEARFKRTATRYRLLEAVPAKGGRVIGSSDQVHVVDALAITGDEGRDSLRKAVGSWQISCDPQVSE